MTLTRIIQPSITLVFGTYFGFCLINAPIVLCIITIASIVILAGRAIEEGKISLPHYDRSDYFTITIVVIIGSVLGYFGALSWINNLLHI